MCNKNCEGNNSSSAINNIAAITTTLPPQMSVMERPRCPPLPSCRNVDRWHKRFPIPIVSLTKKQTTLERSRIKGIARAPLT